MNLPLQLYVSVPLAGFRVAQAREYWESYRYPPPATVYGMLLSLVGEENRLTHAGAELAIALLSAPERSTVLRTAWRIKIQSAEMGEGENRRPELVELLTDIRASVWLRPGKDEGAVPSLAGRVAAALGRPEETKRFGALCLGESTHLVDEVRIFRHTDPDTGQLLIQRASGPITVPIWPDHVGSANTLWGTFEQLETPTQIEPQGDAWVTIRPSAESLLTKSR